MFDSDEYQALFGRIHAVRDHRDVFLAELATGLLTLRDLFQRGDVDPVIATMKVLPSVEALPTAGKVQTRRAFEELDIAEDGRIRDVSAEQRAGLLDALGRHAAMSGRVIVVSGPGGVGKGTVVRQLVESVPMLTLSRSWTTRDPRPGEDPEAYTFVSDGEFLEHIDRGGFLEWDHHFLAYYGSPIPDPHDPNDLVLEIDVNGAAQIAEKRPDAVFIFIDAPSLDSQRERLIGRGDTPEQVERRMGAGQDERDKAASLPYQYVINDDVERAAAEIAALLFPEASGPDAVGGVDGTSTPSC